MRYQRKKVLLIAIGVILASAISVSSQSNQVSIEKYREAYTSLQEALKLSYENRKEEALKKYEEARDKLKNLLERFPDINRDTIEARLAKCEEAIEKLRGDISTPSQLPEPPKEVTERAVQPELKPAGGDLEKTRAERAALEAELKKAREERLRGMERMKNLSTALETAIKDLEKERDEKTKIEGEAMKAHEVSEEVLRSQLAQALAERNKIEEEAIEAYQASEDIMRDLMEKQKQELLQTLQAEREKIASEKEEAAQPVQKLQTDIASYRKQVEKARKELNESLKMIAATHETHKKLLEANEALEKEIASLARSVSDADTEAEFTELQRIASAEEKRLRKADITRGPSLPEKMAPSEMLVLVGEVSEKNDEYGKIFIDFVKEVDEGEELFIIRDNETIAKLKVSKIFPSVKGGIANVIPKEDAYELREKDKVFAVGQESNNPL